MHHWGMRTHSEIAAGAVMAERLTAVTGASVHTCRSWAQRNRIPSEHWAAIAAAGIASLEELASAAASNPRRAPDQQVAA